MSAEEFIQEIQTLIDSRAEGDYWDFKEKWHDNNVDLLHDIICMANSIANRDCYIIIGVKDGTFEVVGVDIKNRKNQQNVLDFLHQKPKWAGGFVPEVYVKNMTFSGKEVDVIIIKQSNNTPFYLLEDYKKINKSLFKGVIYTRKGDTNTPKTQTVDLYDTELLWKRRFGLLYNPSQRVKFYLRDISNWELVEDSKSNDERISSFYYYQLDPDYTICKIIDEDLQDCEILKKFTDVNEDGVGALFFYIFAFANVSYHTDFSTNEKIILYYKDIPLFSSSLECIDEGRTQIIPPEYWSDAYYISDTIQFLMFEFVFARICGNYSSEAKEMVKRVIPIYKTEEEHQEFMCFAKSNGFSRERRLEEKMTGEALERFKSTKVSTYKYFDIPQMAEETAGQLMMDKNMVINFASTDNKRIDEITKYLRVGKMLVEWLEEWRGTKK